MRAPLCRATVPCRPRACLRGHLRSRKSGRRAGAESGRMRRRGGCMRGAGGGSGRRRLCDSRKPPSPPPQRVRRGTRGGSGRRRRRRGGAAAGGGGDVTKVGVGVKWCVFVFQRLFAAAACVRPAGGAVRAPLCRATVPVRPRACLRGHCRSRKSGRRAGAESGRVRRRGGCMRGAGGGRTDHDIFRCRKRPLTCVGALERGRTGGGRSPCLCPVRELLETHTRTAPL